MVLIVFYPIATSRVVGTDVFHSLLLLTATGIAQIRFGNVDLGMVAALLLGSVPGVILGSHLTLKTPTKWLRLILALVLLPAASRCSSRASAPPPVPGGGIRTPVSRTGHGPPCYPYEPGASGTARRACPLASSCAHRRAG